MKNFLDGQFWQYWDSDNRSPGSCGMIQNDPKRYDRCQDASEYGREGSTHAEIIQDWRECLDCFETLDDDDVIDGKKTDFDAGTITETDKTELIEHIDSAEKWHRKQKTLTLKGIN